MKPNQVRGGSGKGGAFALAVVLALFAMLLAIAATPARSQTAGDYFEYEYVQEVKDGSGAYYAWWEKMESHGRYTVQSAEGTDIEMLASYEWTYDASDAPKTHHRMSATNFSFSTDSRKYLSGYDLDVDHGGDPSVWFWISPDVAAGTWLDILNDTFVVKSTNQAVWSNWLPRESIHVVATGSGYRADEYGRFQYTYKDNYYFDRKTGFIIAEYYEEFDEGNWQGQGSTFVWSERFDVTQSSYERPIAWPDLIASVLGVLGVAIAIFGAAYLIRWRSRNVEYGSGQKAKVWRVRNMEKFPHLANEASIYFGDFLEDFARKAILSGGRVAVAVDSRKLQGLAIYHKDAKMGAIFCKNYQLNEQMRRYIGAKDFFSETKHEVETPSQENSIFSEEVAQPESNRRVYNIFETYRVLKLAEIPNIAYDTRTVRRMVPGDMDEVAMLAKKIYKVRSKRWMRSLTETGDLGVVAVVNGKILGFAYATIIGDRARFHTISTSPDARGQGIGKELMRARLHFAKLLGVREVVLEIADWNMPSITISTSFGFQPAGTMYVETTRLKRIKKDIVRR